MSEDLLNCPFCNVKAMFIADSKELVACSNITCHMNHVAIRKTAWNTRPMPIGVPAGKEIVWPDKLHVMPELIDETNTLSNRELSRKIRNETIDEFAKLNPHLKRTEP